MLSKQPKTVGVMSDWRLAEALANRLKEVGVIATITADEGVVGANYWVMVPPSQQRLAERVTDNYCPLCELFDISE